MKTTTTRLLKFRKGALKNDSVEFWMGSEKVVQIQNPKQGIIPHDMVHYAVESCFPFEGFIQLVFDGHEPGKVMEVLHGFAPKLPKDSSQTSWVTESLVEAIQAALWSSETRFQEFEYVYQKACEVRNIKAIPIKEIQFKKCLQLLHQLSKSWSDTQIDGELVLEFAPMTTALAEQNRNYL